MTFFRQAALLLPSAFLLGVLLFLLTHGHGDPGFGTYPFFEQWSGGRFVASSPEARFVEQSALFFLAGYVVTLLFILSVVAAENGVFGSRPRPQRTPYRRAFGLTFAAFFLAGTVLLIFLGERVAARVAPGALVAPVLVAAAPFGGSLLAIPFAAVLAVPLALLKRAGAS